MAKRRLVESIKQLPNLDDEDVLGIDIESTSFDDKEAAFQPFSGHRVAGVGLMTLSGDAWYLPLRHAPLDDGGNLPHDKVIPWLQKLGRRSRTWIGHNIKFDARFLHQDKIELRGDFKDTVVLARIVNPLRFSARLDALCKDYLLDEYHKDDRRVKEELKARRSKDYGVVPPDILGEYCMQDLNGALSLLERLMKDLRPCSKKLWETESKLVRVLLNSELRGVYVPRRKLKKFTHEILQKIVPYHDKVNELANEHVDVLSNKSLTRILRQMAVQPITFSQKTGQPSWDSPTLRSYGLEFCNLVADLKEAYSRFSNYGEGWLRRLADDDTLHPNFKQYGTKTGRLSSEDPNFQNLDAIGKALVIPRTGYCFLSIDYSQIEFRLFAHYTKSANILGKYQDDARTDFHQTTADMLGISRSAAKTINFGMIYGMGRNKLEEDIAAKIKQAILEQDVDLLKKLREFNYGEEVNERNAHSVASVIYVRHHKMMPEIKQYGHRVKNSVFSRLKNEGLAWVQGAFGRVYTKPEAMHPGDFAFKMGNAIIQGGAADLLKDRLADIEPVLEPFNAYLLCNVHDEVLLEVPLDVYVECARATTTHLETPSIELRVPIKVDVQVCFKSWADKHDVKV